jgi:hypothetical protein
MTLASLRKRMRRLAKKMAATMAAIDGIDGT